MSNPNFRHSRTEAITTLRALASQLLPLVSEGPPHQSEQASADKYQQLALQANETSQAALSALYKLWRDPNEWLAAPGVLRQAGVSYPEIDLLLALVQAHRLVQIKRLHSLGEPL